MPIYSTNRVSSASPRRIVAAEGYTDHDFGRILSETYANDMKVFNVGLARDFQEATAINENTMVSSELKALREFSIKEAWKGLVEKLKKLWAKIKGVFRNVYAKLSVWLNRSNKLYVAQNRKYLETKGDLGGCPIPKYMVPKRSITKLVDDVTKDLNEMASKVGEDASKMAKDHDPAMDYGKMKFAANGDEKPTVESVYKIMTDECFTPAKDGRKFSEVKISVSELLDRLSGSSQYLKDLKKASKSCDTAFKKAIGDLNKKANEADTDKAKKSYENTSKAVSAFQTVASAVSGATVKLIRKAISNDRGLVAALVAYDPKAPKTENAMLCEFAFSAGLYALKEETDDMTDEDLEDAAEGGDGEVSINIEIDGTADADVNVEDNTGDDD